MKPGTRLEHYEIGEPLGAGGMGEVYRAVDTRLRRPVAIKVLPQEVASDPERLARLEREAQLLASLNHPNVATVHGFGRETITEDGRQHAATFLVMELIEGPSLHDRLATGPLDWREAVQVGIGIAAGLEAAHERGIVHRDLKPANVHVTEEGVVKVLDFGLAKAFEGDGATGSLELSASPTVAAATRTGMILGTAAYMSPEQARGKPVDRRSDVWALGCVLYEMLVGQKAFHGDTVSDVLASILKDAPDLDALPPVPVRLRHLLERCLAKQPAQRMRDVGDVRLELEAASRESARTANAAGDVAGLSPWLVAALGAVLLAAGLGVGYGLRGGSAPGHEMKLIVSPDSIAAGPHALAVSPNGRWIAETDIATGIRLRAIDGLEWRSLPDTANAVAIAFGAASDRLYFTRGNAGDEGNLLSVGLDGSTPVTEAVIGPGFAVVFRGADGSMMISRSTGQAYGIERFEPGAGLVEVASGELGSLVLVSGQLAPDRWLGWTFTGSTAKGLVVLGVDPADNREILDGYRTPLVLRDGRILALDARARLVSATLDARAGTVVAQPVILLEGLGLASGTAGAYDVSDSGMLVYMSGSDASGQVLSWLHTSGAVEAITARASDYQVDSRVSPDGSKLALEMPDDEGKVTIWIHEIERDVQTALAPGLAASFPVWSPDGTEIAFLDTSTTPPGIYRAPIDRSAAPELLIENPPDKFVLPMDWSADGAFILYVESASLTRNRAATNDLWLLPADGSEPRPFLATAASEIDGRFSPDGRWIAYASDQTERYEIYVRAVAGGGEYRISADSGTSPEWNPAGGQLFFERQGQLYVADVGTRGATPVVSQERPLVRFPAGHRPNLWAPHPDGDRFLIAVLGDPSSQSRSLISILNWSPLQR